MGPTFGVLACVCVCVCVCNGVGNLLLSRLFTAACLRATATVDSAMMLAWIAWERLQSLER